MYTQALNTSDGEDRHIEDAERIRAVSGAHRCRRAHRAE